MVSLIYSLLSLTVLLVTLSFAYLVDEYNYAYLHCYGNSNEKSPPYNDCLLALEYVGTTAFSPFGEGGPPIDTSQRIAWYSPDSAEHIQSGVIIPGTTVPKEWVHGRCRIAVDWQNGQVPPSPAHVSLDMIKKIGTDIAKQCIYQTKRISGDTEIVQHHDTGILNTGLIVSVTTYADHTAASFVDSLVTTLESRSPLYKFLYSANHFLNYRGPSHFP